MSSHREAPAISQDPVADNTDTYAFVTPNHTVTIIANYLPLEGPAGGPNFYEFGEDVLYEIHVDNDGDGKPDVSYQFVFDTKVSNPETFLYNTGPISTLTSPAWNRRQTYTVTRAARRRMGQPIRSTTLASHAPCPPCNIGPRSTPDYAGLAASAVQTLRTGERVFAGQRADAFFVDLGSIFDLGTLRPVESLHLLSMANAPGVDTLKASNVHSIAIQVPISLLTRNGSVPSNPADAAAVLGIWATACRRKARVRGDFEDDGRFNEIGPWVQVSRLGNPLFNEVIVPMAHKDRWNAREPSGDAEFAHYVANPELASLLPVLYPGVFPKLAALKAPRADLLAILMTGIPGGLIPGFQTFTGPTQADMLRLNVAIPPASSPNRLGLLGNDLAGFPNGRRLTDDVVTIELRAIAGATYPLIDRSFTPDAAAVSVIEDGTFGHPGRVLLGQFPYMGTPYSGYSTPAA